MPQTCSITDGGEWPQLAANPNTNAGKKQSLPGHSFGTLDNGRDASNSGRFSGRVTRAPDPFQAGDPEGVATLKMGGVSDEKRDRELGKSLNGTTSLGGSKLASGARSSARDAHITDARRPRGRSVTSSGAPPALIDTRQLSYRDAAVKCTPPPSPSVASPSLPAIPSLPTSPKPTVAHSTPWPPPTTSRERLRLETDLNPFPPLSPLTASKATTGTPVPNSSTRSSYAKCLEPTNTSRAAPAPESPDSAGPTASPSTAKTITLNINALNRVPAAPRRAPTDPVTPNRPGRKKSSTSPAGAGPRLPAGQRARSASVSSISSTPSFISSAPTSIATAFRSWESEEWYIQLVTFARQMTKRNRRAWEKILRCDPKDRSKMKWSEFDSALKALGFESKTRGGSDLEYTPSRFGDNAQPISYHRPHPGQEFSLGDLKAKACSFRGRYPAAVAAMHEAWNLVDTRS